MEARRTYVADTVCTVQQQYQQTTNTIQHQKAVLKREAERQQAAAAEVQQQKQQQEKIQLALEEDRKRLQDLHGCAQVMKQEAERQKA